MSSLTMRPCGDFRTSYQQDNTIFETKNDSLHGHCCHRVTVHSTAVFRWLHFNTVYPSVLLRHSSVGF